MSLMGESNSHDDDAIKRNLEQDSSVDTPDTDACVIPRFPSICIALRSNASIAAIRLLLAFGISPDCMDHSSVLECAISNPDAKFNTDALKLLVEAGTDLTQLDASGQSPLCHALRRTTDASFINLLLRRGCQLDSCIKHLSSALNCLLNRDPDVILTSDVMEIVTESGTHPCLPDEDLLSMALKSGVYETAAVERLVYFLEEMPYRIPQHISWRLSALFDAVLNPHCKVGAVKLLISQGANVTYQKSPELPTPLHAVVSLPSSRPTLLKLLAKDNPRKNDLNLDQKSALHLCIEKNPDANMAALMFAEGCRLNNKRMCYYLDIRISNNALPSLRTPEKLRFLKSLIKFELLENPDFRRTEMVACEAFPDLYNYAEACSMEITNMQEIEIYRDFTLYDFVMPKRDSLENPIITPQQRSVTLNRLLNAMSGYNFNIYYDVIVSYIPIIAFKTTLEEVMEFITIPNSLPNGERFSLNTEIIVHLSDYLPPIDILNFIFAYIPPYVVPTV